MNETSKLSPLWSLILLVTASLSLVSSTLNGALSYTFALTDNRKIEQEGIYRALALQINKIPVGHITYKIYPNSSKPSVIEILHVEKGQRQHKGYGKALLYQALNDIVQSGGSQVELTRCPFDLNENEPHTVRDMQLKKFYGRFGFADLDRNNTMRLNLAKLSTVAMVSFFKENDIQFDLHEQQSVQAA